MLMFKHLDSGFVEQSMRFEMYHLDRGSKYHLSIKKSSLAVRLPFQAKKVITGIYSSQGLVEAPDKIDIKPGALLAWLVAYCHNVFHSGFKMAGDIAGEDDGVLAHECPGKPG